MKTENKTLTIKYLREMELPVRLIQKHDQTPIDVLYLGETHMFVNERERELSIHLSHLISYQLAPKTKPIQSGDYIYVDDMGRFTNYETKENIDKFRIKYKAVISEETGEIISREVSAE